MKKKGNIKQSTLILENGLETGSFRDRNGRVFYLNNKIYRSLSDTAYDNWQQLETTLFYKYFLNKKKIIVSQEIKPSAQILKYGNGHKYFLSHEKIPFISYPYEWTFSMLKEASLLQLRLLQNAIKENMILKDSSPFNIQFVASKPVFIDIPSFEKLRKNEPWVGYNQFCMLFLYPLLLMAYKQVDFHDMLRGNLDGISVEDINNLMNKRDLFRPGIFKHVYLQSKLKKNYQNTNQNIKKEMSSAGFHKDLILANIKSLIKLVKKLNTKEIQSQWSDYTNIRSYNKNEINAKFQFVEKIIQKKKRKLVWDVGANTGEFSFIAAKNSDYVISMDYDHLAVEKLFITIKNEKIKNILPLIMNIAKPSPAIGWQLKERKTLLQRGRPDLILALAVIHHLVISANIPTAEVISYFAEQSDSLLIEFVTKEDVMVKKLLLNKEDIYIDYEQENFEKELKKYYTKIQSEVLESETRILYYCQK